MDRAVGIADDALAYLPELGFLSFGGRWRGSFGSYLNKSGFDSADAGLSFEGGNSLLDLMV